MKSLVKYFSLLLVMLLVNIGNVYAATKGIILNDSIIFTGVGVSQKLNYELASGLSVNDIIWKSDKPDFVSVSSDGVITGNKIGDAYITASINGVSSSCKVIVNSDYVAVKSISFKDGNKTILKGSSEKLDVIVTPVNASSREFVYNSTNPSVASVDSYGNVSAKSVGKAIITVTLSGRSASMEISVVDKIDLKGISIDKTNVTIKENESTKLNIVYNPNNATNKGVTWKSSNNNIVRVDSNGNITAVSAGVATITAISSESSYVAASKITVEALSKNVTGVSLDKSELNMVIGDETTLNVNINPSYAENKKVTWESSDKNIATVENGLVKAKKVGVAEIKVITEDGKKEAICKVTISAPPLKGISFKEKEKVIYLSEKGKLTLVVDPVEADISKLVFTSSDEKIVVIEEGNVIKGVSLGETDVVVSNEDKSITSTIKVIVKEKPKDALKIEIDGYDLNFSPKVKDYELKIGKEKSLKITTNVDKDKVTINGNKNLKDGSVITINVSDPNKVTYVIKISKDGGYTIYFIIAISVLLFLNIIRIIVKGKKNK